MSYGSIEIKEICERTLNGIVLDIFFIVMESDGISKKEIMNVYKEHAGVKSLSSQKYRFKIDEALAILEALLFISSDREGLYKRYYITEYGLKAKDVLRSMLDAENIQILRGSIVVKHIAMGGGTK
ncbi:hypothetical protein ABES02_29845 [Neobacillus pocheonensis]|uniref:hypothetical protein n=1 Tax=Neobacillus pocheonensis TaxID=363869 RepID=UPI003D28362A